MNVENPKLQDINVRQAIRYALDVPGMVKATYMGQADVEYALIPPGLVGYWKDAPKYERDVAKAKEYMQKAGIDTLDLKIDIQDTTEYRSWAEIAQQNLKEIGINLTINPLDSSAYWSLGAASRAKRSSCSAATTACSPIRRGRPCGSRAPRSASGTGSAGATRNTMSSTQGAGDHRRKSAK